MNELVNGATQTQTHITLIDIPEMLHWVELLLRRRAWDI